MNKEQTKKAIEVMQAYVDGREIEFFDFVDLWLAIDNPSWNWIEKDYRIKPAEKPTINWEYVADKYKYAAKDADDVWYFYVEEPFINVSANVWRAERSITRIDLYHKNIVQDPDNVDWKESLVIRP